MTGCLQHGRDDLDSLILGQAIADDDVHHGSVVGRCSTATMPGQPDELTRG